MNTFVKFELAKLLKEKGYDKPCYDYFRITGTGSFKLQNAINHNDDVSQETVGGMTYISAPTIAEVVMWLYEKHGIWIRVTPYPYSDTLTHWRWEHMSTNYSTRSLKWSKKQDYMSPTEAYEAAIEYCLTKLL